MVVSIDSVKLESDPVSVKREKCWGWRLEEGEQTWELKGLGAVQGHTMDVLW